MQERFDRWWLSAWIFPIISACMWLGMLLAMFCTWEAQGHPHLPSMEKGQRIAYISDIGAFGLKPLFITGSVITTIFMDLGFVSERWLRHYGRLAPNTSHVQSTLSSISIFFAIAGTCGLICLSNFDTYHYPKIHDGCLLLFIGGYWLSAVFLCAEYQRLGVHYRRHRILALSFWIKLIFIVVELILAVVFASTSWSSHQNIAAIFEWIVALVFTFYVLSFAIDLWPSVRSKKHTPQGWQIESSTLEKGPRGNTGSGMPASDELQNHNVGNSDDTLTNNYRGVDATGGYKQETYPAGHQDLGRQKKRGLGRWF